MRKALLCSKLLPAFLSLFLPDPAEAYFTASFFQGQNACNSYPGLVKSMGFTNYWRFAETTGSTTADSIGTDPGTFINNPGLAMAGPLVAPSWAISLDGSSQHVITASSFNNPTVFTILVWFKTTTPSGGKLVGFGNNQSGYSTSYDRHIYMTNNGNIAFGVYNGSTVSITAPLTYNDGKWHMAAATLSSSGMLLSVDGLVVTNANTSAENHTGYWRIGFDNLSGWDSQPSSLYFAGSIGEVAIANGVALSSANIQTLYGIGSTCGTYSAPPPTLYLSGVPTTALSKNCVAAGQVTTNSPPATALTVNLSGSGLTFYSDPFCTSSITSTTISAGTSSSPAYYLLAPAATSTTLTASSSGYASATGSETVTASPFVWTGNGGGTAWNANGNWSGGTAPGGSDVAIFDGSCTANCSPTISSGFNIGGLRMASDYAGTITQSGSSITIGTGAFVQLGGTFIGSSGAFDMTVNSLIRVAAGSFTAPGGNLATNTGINLSGSASFSHNSGTFQILSSGNAPYAITPGTSVFNNVSIDSTYVGGGISVSGTWNVAGSFSAYSGNNSPPLNGGIINVSKNISFSGALAGGSATVRAVGVNQTISTTQNSSLTNLEIASTGTTTFTGTLSVGGDYTYTSGTINATGSVLKFGGDFLYNRAGSTFTPGNQTYADVYFFASYVQTPHTLVGTFNVQGNLTLDAGNYFPAINGGTFNVKGNMTVSGSWQGGSAQTIFSGSGAQTLTVSATMPTGGVTVNGASSQLVLGSSVSSASGGWTVTAGSIYLSGNSLTIPSLSLNSTTVHTKTTTASGTAGILTVGGSTIGNGAAFGGTIAP